MVVVVDVVDNDPLELGSVPHEGAVQEFASQRADPPFSESVRDRCPNGGLEDLDAFGAEDLVERSGELTAAVAHQCFAAGECLAVTEEQVACGTVALSRAVARPTGEGLRAST